MKELDVVVIGGGLAGLSCSEVLSDAGRNIVLLEARRVLGGRTSSWDDDGMNVESGLQRFLGFYTELPTLLQRAGIKLNNLLHWEDEIEIRQPSGKQATLTVAALLHKPLLTPGVVGSSDFLSLKDRTQLGHFFTSGQAKLISNPHELDMHSTQSWADMHQLSPEATGKVLVPLTDGFFFLQPREFSAYAFFRLVSLAADRLDALRVGTFTGGMTETMIRPLSAHIERLGGEIVTDAAVQRLHYNQRKQRWTVETKWAQIDARAVVIATSLAPAQQLLANSFRHHAWFEPLFSLSSHPAVSLQLKLDRPAMRTDRITFGPGTALASFSEQSRTTFRGDGGRLSIILSNPTSSIELTAGKLLQLCLQDAAKLGLEVGSVVDYRKVMHRHDFYRPSPGIESKRPAQRTPIDGLFLAGDYTRQPFLTTMEGAVISGRLAAEAVLDTQ